MNRKYNCNNSYFSKDNINEFSLYWAGFLAADGCVYVKENKKYTLNLYLNEKDVSHLLLFNICLENTGPVKSRINKDSLRNPKWHDTTTYGSVIHSKQITTDLDKNYNIIPRKTHVYEMPEWLIKHSLVHHFVRGYFDGDGSIYLQKRPYSIDAEVSFRGTLKFLQQIKEIIESSSDVRSISFPKKSNGIGKLQYNGSGLANNLYKFLYKDANIYLSRKFDKFRMIAKDI